MTKRLLRTLASGALPRRSWMLVLLLGTWVATASADTREVRIALVIGISNYQNAPHLPNPLNDAHAIGDSLRRLNFDVVELDDPDYRKLSHGLREFGIRAADADAAVIYYAGHGVQVDHENYLLPSDAKLERERDLLYEAMPLSLMLGEISQARKIGIVLLDACRNNPFVERVGRGMAVAGRAIATQIGLARVDNVPRNTMVVMATKADQVADDGSEHSPFAAALLAHFQIPGLELSLFFRSVRDTVLRATNNRQEPYVFSSLGAEPFYFYPRPPNRPPQIAAVKPLTVTEVAGPTPLGIPRPTDPDDDPLTVRITGLPRAGEVLVEGRAVARNELFALDKFMGATFKPDGKTLGPLGTLDLLIEDGRGGTATASLPINVISSNHPPVVEAERVLRVFPAALNIAPPTDPDGDPLTVTITALPRGSVRNGAATLHAGDRIRPQDLAGLIYLPEPGFAGTADSLRYSVDDGRGGVVEGKLDIEVADPSEAADLVSESGLWETVQHTGKAEDIEAFRRLFPHSRFAAAAAKRLEELAATTPPAAAPQPVESQQATPSPAPPPSVATVPAAPQPAPGALQPAPTAEPNAPSPATILAPPPTVTERFALLQPALPSSESSDVPRTMPPPPAVPTMRSDGKTFQDCPDCPVMVRVPAGSFTMGLGAREPEAMPPHPVSIRAFAIGQFPVTIGEWKACMKENGCDFLPRMATADDRAPVHNLSWDDTHKYSAWLSRKTGHKYRLPSEAEWEYAARAHSTTRYWWGNEPGIALANCADCGGPQQRHVPLPVNAFRPNEFGLYDILGGVAEWTEDCWFPNYRNAPTNGSAREEKDCLQRVLRGGSFRATHEEITVVSRGNYDSSVRYLVNGFRVARDLD
jgi:formylglycine-generating enzyme required for sulfatase activity